MRDRDPRRPWIPGTLYGAVLLGWAGPGRDARDSGPGTALRWTWRLGLAVFAMVFLGYTLAAGALQDYALYQPMWNEVRQGRDPWFLSFGVFGNYPLNSYGPLFNALALPAGIHPLLPKLLFAFAYLMFAFGLIAREESRPQTATGMLGCLAWLGIPYVWVEIPHYGHFDVLVGLLCVAAIEARRRDRDTLSGVLLALGILLKFMPIVLLPFVALDGKRIRWRLVAVTLGATVLGMGASALVWGPSTFRPLAFASGRSSHHLSIYRFLKGRFSPMVHFDIRENPDHWAPLFLMAALTLAWSWCRRRQLAAYPSALLAMMCTVLFYQVGFAQYQMVPFMLASCLVVANPPGLSRKAPLTIALCLYFGWVSVFDVLECRVKIDDYQLQDWIGLPTFVLGCAVIATLLVTADLEVRGLKVVK